MRLCYVCAVLAVLLLAIPAVASDQIENSSPINRDQVAPHVLKQSVSASTTLALRDGPPYFDGSLRIYVVEETSSLGWRDLQNQLYEFPFLAYAINSALTLNDTVWDTTVTWDGYDFGYNSLRGDNIAVQAVLFSNSNGLPAAAAMAYPGIPGSNYVNTDSGYTHTVFVEEGTATW